MTESKPAPEFVMHQVPVFDTHKDHRVPGITAQNIRKGSLSELYAADTSRETYESPHRHTQKGVKNCTQAYCYYYGN